MTNEGLLQGRLTIAAALAVLLIIASAPAGHSAATLAEQTDTSTLGETEAAHVGIGLPTQKLGNGISGTAGSVVYKLNGATVADDVALGWGEAYLYSCPSDSSPFNACTERANSGYTPQILSQSGNDAVVLVNWTAAGYTFDPDLYYYVTILTGNDLAVYGSATNTYIPGESGWLNGNTLEPDANIPGDLAFRICDTAVCDLTPAVVADTEAPAVTAAGGLFDTAVPTLMGSTTDPISPVSLQVHNVGATVSYYYATTTTSDSWYLTIPDTDALPDGDYTLSASSTDAAGNASAEISVGISIDTTAPVVTIDAGPHGGAYASSTTTTFTFTATDAHLSAVTCSYDGEPEAACTSPHSTSTLADGAHSFTVTATDSGGRSTSATSAFTQDATAPALAEVTAVASGTSTTPSYAFSSTEAGAIAYGGSCASATTVAATGTNAVVFNALAVGTYSDCTIAVTDIAANTSALLAVTPFTIEAVPVAPAPAPTPDPAPAASSGSSGGNGVVDGPLSVGYQISYAPAAVIPTVPQEAATGGVVAGASTEAPAPYRPAPTIAHPVTVATPAPEEPAPVMPTQPEPAANPWDTPTVEPQVLGVSDEQDSSLPWWLWGVGGALILGTCAAFLRRTQG